MQKLDTKKLQAYFFEKAKKQRPTDETQQLEVSFRIYNQDLICELLSIEKWIVVFIECNYAFFDVSEHPENDEFSFRKVLHTYQDIYNAHNNRDVPKKQFHSKWHTFNKIGTKFKIYPEIAQGLKNGLYKIYWKKSEGGGSSLAAIGSMNDGRSWVAPTNWISDGKDIEFDCEQWDKIKAVKPIKFRK